MRLADDGSWQAIPFGWEEGVLKLDVILSFYGETVLKIFVQ